MTASTFSWRSAAVTNPGKVRTVNEDAELQRSSTGLWVVADGMGGHEAGDLASGMIVESLAAIADPGDPIAFLDLAEDTLMDVNRRLHEEATSGAVPRTIGSTVVVLIVREGLALLLWAGDSRAYRMRDDRLTRITTDHSQVEEMIEQGELLREDAETHPMANVITRAVGGEEELRLEVTIETLRDGDRYMLCSDGLYKDVSEDEMSSVLAHGDCERVANEMVELVLEREAADNITVVVIDFEDQAGKAG